MLDELHGPPNALVIHNLPSETKARFNRTPTPISRPMKIIYAGNISTYGPMVEAAARQCMNSDSIRLEIFGREPIRWSGGTIEAFRNAGIYKGFVSPDDFPRVANDYDFVLAIMSFEPELRQRMRTCFLSKIIELAQLGKPIIIWGPSDCSAVVWARKRNAALCITTESSKSLLAALEQLANTPKEQRRLVQAIKTSAENEFNPRKIRRRFMEVLAAVTERQGANE